MGGITPSGIAEACLVHGLLAAGEIDSLRESYCLALGSTDHLDCQHACKEAHQGLLLCTYLHQGLPDI